jgi:hypothetical protein
MYLSGLGAVKDCGCGLTIPDTAANQTCPGTVDPATGMTAGCQSFAALSAPAAPCPPGYGVPTFQDGLNWAINGLPFSLFGGPLNLTSLGNTNPGNVALPDHITPCFQANRTSAAQLFGQALPGLLLLGVAVKFFFGKAAR